MWNLKKMIQMNLQNRKEVTDLDNELRATREGISHICFLYYILLRYSGCARFACQLNEHTVYFLVFKELYEIRLSFLFGRIKIV